MEDTIEIRLDEAKVAQTATQVKAVCDAIGARVDADESIFLAQELEQMLAKEFTKKRAPLKAREFIPINTELDPGAETFSYPIFDEFGAAKIISDYADDMPSFDVSATKATGTVKTLGGMFHYSVPELQNAAFAKKSLDTRKQQAAVRGFERGENTILLTGNTAHGLMGFINADAANGGNVPTVSVVADGTGSTKTWSTKTAAQIIRDLDALVRTVGTQSNAVHTATTVILPYSSYGLIEALPFSVAGGSDKTVLAWWKANHPGVEVGWLNELETAGSGATRRMMAYVRDPEMVEGMIPQPYQQLPPQAKGLRFEVPCFSRIGGVAWYFPLSACYGDGI